MNIHWQRFLEYAAGRSVNGSLRSLDGVGAAWTNSLLPFLNATYLTSPVASKAEFERRVAVAHSDAAGRQLPWGFFVFEPYAVALGRPTTVETLADCGMTFAMSVEVMTADTTGLAPARPSPVTFRRVLTEDDMHTVMSMNCRAYGLPVDMADSIVASRAFYHDTARDFGYLALADGLPVSTTTVIELDGLLYVALVATEPDHVRRGYADAVMRHALAEAARATGITQATLDATTMGAPVYERMGFAKSGEVWSMYTATTIS
jgi:GNAT superfamily N-acetyltransferase